MSGADDKSTTLHLFLPDFSALDLLWKSDLPFALWPVGGQPLIHHWMDYAVRQNYARVEIRTADRPAEIRARLEGGAYWSRPVTVIPVREGGTADAGERLAAGLPDQPVALPASPADLLRLWWQLNLDWLRRFEARAPRLEVEPMAGCYIGPRCRIHPSAVLRGPLWLGSQVEIGPRCQIGPLAVIGSRSIIDADAEISEAVVLKGSYAGAFIGLKRKIADGGILLDVDRGVRVDIAESFILSRPQDADPPPGVFSRALALVCWLALALPALLLGGPRIRREGILLASGETLALSSSSRGPLLIRRWDWLGQIVRGRLHWVGVLPRTSADLQSVPVETAQRIRSARVGVFSLADLHGVHDPQSEEEWIHAAYQALGHPREIRRLLLKNMLQLWTTLPH